MRPEKEFLVSEVTTYLENGEYLYLADYTGISVSETENQTLTFHIHSLNSRFEDLKKDNAKNNLEIKEEIKNFKSEFLSSKLENTPQEDSQGDTFRNAKSIKTLKEDVSDTDYIQKLKSSNSEIG